MALCPTRMLKVLVIFPLLTSLCLAVTAQAQEPAAFSTLTLRGGISLPGSGVTIPGGWDERPGFELSGSTPFYLGILEGALRLNSWKRLASDLPAFTSRSLFLGWHLPLLEVTSRSPITAGWRVGITQMEFDDPDATWHDRTDHELESGPVLGLTLSPGNAWDLRFSAGWSVLRLSEKIDRPWILLSAGIRFTTPAWLREFLQ